jgi:hypothetical protein
VMATVTDVQSKQDWKYGERWSRNPWNGNLEREKTWQTYYTVTAKWVQPATITCIPSTGRSGSLRGQASPREGVNCVFCSILSSLTAITWMYQLLSSLEYLSVMLRCRPATAVS